MKIHLHSSHYFNRGLVYILAVMLCAGMQPAVGQTMSSSKVTGKMGFMPPGPSFSLNSGVFNESSTNDGSIDNSAPKTITLSTGSFNGSINEDFVASNKVIVAGLPSGLTAVMTLTSSNVLTVTITGNAADHASGNSVTNISFTMQDASVPGGDVVNIFGHTMESIDVTFISPTLTYSSSAFTEAGANNGSINNSSPITITLNGDTFDQTIGNNLVAENLVTLSNLPAGLSAVITVASTTTLSVTFTGTATNHSAVNGVSNIGFTFLSGTFSVTSDPTSIANYNKSDISVSFNDPSTALLGGNTLVLDGSGDYVLSSNTLGNFGSGDFTIELWVKTTVSSRNILGKRFSGSHGSFFVLAMDGSGKPGLELDEDDNGTNYSATSATTSVSDGNWHHIACTRSGTTISYYRDGVLDGQSTADVASISNGTAFSIGTRYADGFGYGGFFNGSIDDVRLWNVARSQAQIAANKDSYISSTTSGLIGNFRFDESSGSTTAEIVNQSANTGTLYGDAQFSNTPLPVELVSFNSVHKQNAVELHWKTATEVNNLGFEVERRAIDNGKLTMDNWLKAGFVEGNGTSNAPKEYSFVDKGLSAGKFSYRLKQIDRDGKFSYSPEAEVTVGSVPNVFALEQNYPNPFNPSTTISFTLQVSGLTTLKVYDAIGREVAELANEFLKAGTYQQRTFNASQMSSGIYFARLVSDNKTQIKKMMLLK